MGEQEIILSLFAKHQGYLHTQDVLDAGIHIYHLNKLVKSGAVEKVKWGLYRLASLEHSDEMEEVSRIVPNGIFCLFSAWNYYELSDFVPPNYHLAIEKSQKIVLPDYPPIQIYRWVKSQWEIGITTVIIGNSSIKIYDKEKSVCDSVKFRNKVGKDVEKEVLRSYLASPERDLEKLLATAKQLRVEKRLNTYLKIML